MFKLFIPRIGRRLDMQVDPTKTKSRSTGLRAKLLPAAIALLLTSSAIVQAGQSDFEKPITVDSKNQFLDGKNKTSIFQTTYAI